MVAFLTKVHISVTEAFDQASLTQMLTEFGLGFHSHLLNHFKQFQVNAAGGLILSKYVTKVTSQMANRLATLKLIRKPLVDGAYPL